MSTDEKFPAGSVLCVMAIMLTNCINISFIYPFAGFFVVHLGVTEVKAEVGYFVGIIASMYHIGRGLASFGWGMVADIYGRRFVLLISLCSSGICMFAFGFSTSLFQLCLWRFLAGVLNCSTIVSKVVVTEITSTPEHANRGQSWLQASWGIGLILGPSLGGYLSEPCSTDSDLFGSFGTDDNILCTYPYALPGMAGALLCLFVLPCWYMLPGTVSVGHSCRCFSKRSQFQSTASYAKVGSSPTKLQSLDVGKESPTNEATVVGNVDSGAKGCDEEFCMESQDKTTESVHASSYIAVPEHHSQGWCRGQFLKYVFVNALHCSSVMMFGELVSLWCMLPTAHGGPQWSAGAIGKTWAMFGLMLLALQMSVIPTIINFFGTARALQFGLLLSSLCSALPPWLVALNAAKDTRKEGNMPPTTLLLGLVTVVSGVNQIASQFAVVPLSTLINQSVDAGNRARAAGFAFALQALAMALAPAIGGTILAATVEIAGDKAADPISVWPGGTHPAFLLSCAMHLISFCLLSAFREDQACAPGTM